MFKSFLEEVERGRQGFNVGLFNGFHRLNEYLYGLQRRTYYTIGGESGSGKSSLALNGFVYAPYVYAPDKSKVRILYLSFELPKEEIIAKLNARYLFDKAGIITDINEIFSRRQEHRVSDEIYNAILASGEFFEKFEDHLHIVDSAMPPDKIEEVIQKFVMLYGKFKEVIVTNADGLSYKDIIYVPDDPTMYMVVILDHAGKIPGSNKKNVIDEVSHLFVEYRNKCGISPVMINQLNRDSNDVQRIKLGHVDPKTSDWKDTNCVIEDSNVALSIFNPIKHKLATHRGYDAERLGDRHRSIGILKNRYGPDDKYIGMGYYGEISKFIELPKIVTPNDYELFSSIAMYQRSKYNV
jgi:replicative DNA helicase